MIVKQPGHLTSMKNDRGPGTSVYREVCENLRSTKGGKRGGRTYLQLVLASLRLRRWVEEIYCENLRVKLLELLFCYSRDISPGFELCCGCRVLAALAYRHG